MITTVEGVTLTGVYATDEVPASTLPIGTGPAQGYRTLLRVVVPVTAGDVLDVIGRARVTNDTDPGYTVGVGYHLWAYDADSGQGSSGPWTRISSYCGDNVDRTRHHMPLIVDTVYTVPDDWPTGHRIVVVLRGDAMSTRADGQSITVDKAYGQLTVRRYTPTA
ncbi:hypothetical protein ACF07S_10530 [Streptomyces sp. NPDC016640]|uniref:hypothetical protein n=1 Tax=Streptomyces sp. NPDC016640 TaxID=3364969 RepID=UPI0036FFB10D